MSISRLFCALSLALIAATAHAALPNLTAVEMVPGLYQPTGVFFAPGDDTRMYITEQWTRHIVLVKNGIRQATPFLTVPPVADSSTGNEIGLLSMAFDPDYASNGFVYVDYNPPPVTISGTTFFTVKVVRYTRSAANPETLDPNSAVDVISVTKQAQNHNGSFLAFNPRDLADPVKRHYLYVSFGDGGGGGDGGPGHTPIGNAQSTRTLLGKIVRIDVDPASHPNGGYAIPADNPTLPVSTADGLSGPSLREIWIMGLRNPWRASFDRANGDLYIGDVGDSSREEIDILPYGQQAGANLGWAIREGDVAGTRPDVVPVVTPLRDPAYAYQRGAAIGGFVYRGAAIPALVGTYLFADYGGSGTMGCFTPDPAGNTVGNVVTSLKTQIETSLGHGLGGNVSSWGQDNAGELYFCCHNGNPANATSLYLLRADSALKPPAFATTPPTAATNGFPYSYAFTVSGNPAPTLTLDQAPAGMVISGNTVQWSNPTLGSWPVVLRAANGQSPDAIQSFTLAVAGLRAGDPVAAADLEDGVWVSRYNGTWNALPDFDGLTAIDCVKSATVAVDATTQANAQNANYGLRFTGFLNVTNPGVYQFFLASDDGSRFRIGDKVVIDNDGPHGTITQSGSIGLDIGLHRFSVEYFQGGGGANVGLQWAPPGGSQAAIPTGWIKRWITPPGVDVATRPGPYLNGTMPTSTLGTMPATLSATGAFRSTAGLIPAAGVVPYQVNSPLWSDATSKWRWIAVPDGTRATLNPAGNWTFPVGTVLVKHFEYPGKRVETRLLVTTPTGAYGVTYRWRADNSDADLVAAAGSDEILVTGDGSKPWHYPSQNECMQCHTPVSGYVLGARTEQLNMPAVVYSSTGRTSDQLATLAKGGLVAGYDSAQAAGYPALANVADASKPLDKRARSYLQSNCAMCHQPGGPTPAMMDFRYYVDDGQGHPLVPSANYIDVVPSNTLGIANARIVAPGSVAASVLYQRIIATDPAIRMPPLARQTVDATGTAAINQWISGLGGQPANLPPTAAAATSAATLALPANQVALTGTAGDPEGRALAYAWSVASGTAANVAFATPIALSTTATFAAAGTYILRLTVTDDLPQSATADVTVTVNAASAWTTAAAIDCGKATGTPITADGITWALDATMGADRVEGPADFAGTTTLDAVYQTNKTGGDFTYVFTGLAAGTYRARVLTTEVYFTQAGSRRFDVSANGVAVATGIDPFALAGARFTASQLATTTFAPDANGSVALRFQATVDAALVTALVLERQGTANLPPTVSAASSTSALTLPANQATLTGTASDPEGHALTYAWSVAAGTAANVAFATPDALSTTATFAAAGTYVLRLTATDDLPQSRSADVTVTVAAAAGGWTTVAAIDCGKATGTPITADGITWALDATMAADRVEGPADFAGTTTLDSVYQTNKTGGDFTYGFTGLAAGTYRARVLTTEVYFTAAGKRVFNVSANGTVVATGIDPFALAGAKFTASEAATAAFSPDANGTVALRFQASVDAALVTALVLERQGAANLPPSVGATASATALTLPANQVALSGTASDPEGHALAYAWSVAAGPAANVAFATPTALSTTATFAAAGTYVLRLTATDDLPQSRSADVTVTVAAAAGGWTTVAAIDCGRVTGTPITADGITWALDPTMAGDRVEGPADFAGTTTLDAVYQTNQTGGDFTYAFTGLAAGTYRARVLTTEVWFTQAGSRVFKVAANGTDVATGIDPFALAGARFTAAEVATATFPPDANGVVQLRFTAAIDAALVTALVLERQVPNQPPSATAAANAGTITLPANQVTLAGTASDADGTVAATRWSVVSGTAANVTIADPAALGTTATFSAAGTYVLRLTATDNQGASGTAQVQVVVNPAAVAAIQINFQPADGSVPAGWIADTGAPYGARGNGQTYGWTVAGTPTDISGAARRRNAADSPDVEHDTLIHMAKQNPAAVWEIALPNGTYDIDLLCGDPGYTDMVDNLVVEGVALRDPDGQDHWDEFQARVTVADGKLTVAMAADGQNAKLDAITIAAVPSAPQ